MRESCPLCEEFSQQLGCAITALRNIQFISDLEAVIAPMRDVIGRYQQIQCDARRCSHVHE